MNTTARKHTTTYTLPTCKRCGYITGADEELCKACTSHSQEGPTLFK